MAQKGESERLRDIVPVHPGIHDLESRSAPGEARLESLGETLVRVDPRGATEVGGVETEVHFIVNTLGYSRRFHFWATDSEDAEHTYEGLIRSFEHFGGVPAEVLVDNQKVAVLEHWSGQGPRFNER